MKVVQDSHLRGEVLSKNQFVDSKRYVNCHFERCNLSEYRFTVCEFIDCVFTNCNFTNAFLAKNIEYESGKFEKCIFNNCNLTGTSFDFPIIDKCEFRNCKLRETQFDGSRFSNTSFIGEVNSCFFSGYSPYAGSGRIISLSKFDARKVPNKMINVDFSQTKMVGNTFEYGIDLSDCKFPEGPEYAFIPDLKRTVQKAIKIVETDFPEGKEREMALGLIEDLYNNKNMQEQKNLFIDHHIFLTLPFGREVSLRLFALMKRLS